MTQEQGWQLELTDFPPTVISVENAEPLAVPALHLPWASEMQLSSLWSTAEQMTLHAAAIASEFRGHRAGRAALFAFAAEVIAVGSVGTALLPLLALVFPPIAMRALFNPSFAFSLVAMGTGAVLVMAALMVALHGFWALGVELGAWRHNLPRAWHSGLALAFYSCGWDLITSPFGVLALLIVRNRRRVVPTVQAALHAPRACVVTYLESARGFSRDEQRRVMTFAAWVTAPVVLALALALLVGLVLILV